MKFTITSITEGRVRGLSDNPIPRPKSWHEATTQDNIHYDVWEKAKMTWQEAEANRKEYDVISEYAGMIFCDESTTVGSRIEGDIINNEIVNVKLE